MKGENSSIAAPAATPKRNIIDITEVHAGVEKAAIEDSAINGFLYTIPEYTREIVQQFLYIREHCRQNDLPLYRPVDIADAIITGDITINPISKS